MPFLMQLYIQHFKNMLVMQSKMGSAYIPANITLSSGIIIGERGPSEFGSRSRALDKTIHVCSNLAMAPWHPVGRYIASGDTRPEVSTACWCFRTESFVTMLL